MAQFRTAEMTALNLNGIHYKLVYFEEDFTHLTSSGNYIPRLNFIVSPCILIH